MTELSGRTRRRWLMAIFAVYILGHLYFLTAAPNGYHQWRESDTAAVALNFYQEDMTPWHPRVNQRGTTDGVTGMELPLYNYSVALLYHLTVPEHAVARLFSMVCGAAALLFLYLIAARLFDERTALCSAAAMSLSPLFAFYSSKIMPDILMLALWLGAIWMFLKFVRDRRTINLVISAVLLALAAGIKPLCLSIFLPMSVLLWRNSPKRGWDAFLFVIYMTFAFGAVLLWLEYAKLLQRQSGLGAFYLGAGLGQFYQHLFTAEFIKHLFAQWPWELWIGWGMVPAMVLGLIRVVRQRLSMLPLWWLLACYIVFALVSLKSSTHDYYTIIAVPPLALLTGLGLSSYIFGRKWHRIAAAGLLVVALAITAIRIHHRYVWPDEYLAIRSATEELIDRNQLVIVEDPAGPIRLYQMNRHGWALRSGTTPDQIADYFDQGASWLLLEKPIHNYPPEFQELVDTTVTAVGPFHAYHRCISN